MPGKKKAKSKPKPARRAPSAAKTRRKAAASEPSASELIDRRIEELDGWRGATLARMRALILEAVPGITEAWKWSVPVWSKGGIVCTGEAYKQVVKLTFARGASLPDPSGLFNASLGGNTRRAIDLREGEKVDARAFKALVRAAVAENGALPGTKTPKKPAPSKAPSVVLLAGGNPQIAKGDGDAPVQAYIAAMPGWKRALGARLDRLIVQNVPKVQKAVRWNSPFYGVEGRGWFLSFHVFTRYVKVTFFNGLSLRPVPPGGTEKSKDARWIDLYADDELDEDQLAAWVKQAAARPGWTP